MTSTLKLTPYLIPLSVNLLWSRCVLVMPLCTSRHKRNQAFTWLDQTADTGISWLLQPPSLHSESLSDDPELSCAPGLQSTRKGTCYPQAPPATCIKYKSLMLAHKVVSGTHLLEWPYTGICYLTTVAHLQWTTPGSTTRWLRAIQTFPVCCSVTSDFICFKSEVRLSL